MRYVHVIAQDGSALQVGQPNGEPVELEPELSVALVADQPHLVINVNSIAIRHHHVELNALFVGPESSQRHQLAVANRRPIRIVIAIGRRLLLGLLGCRRRLSRRCAHALHEVGLHVGEHIDEGGTRGQIAMRVDGAQEPGALGRVEQRIGLRGALLRHDEHAPLALVVTCRAQVEQMVERREARQVQMLVGLEHAHHRLVGHLGLVRHMNRRVNSTTTTTTSRHFLALFEHEQHLVALSEHVVLDVHVDTKVSAHDGGHLAGLLLVRDAQRGALHFARQLQTRHLEAESGVCRHVDEERERLVVALDRLAQAGTQLGEQSIATATTGGNDRLDGASVGDELARELAQIAQRELAAKATRASVHYAHNGRHGGDAEVLGHLAVPRGVRVADAEAGVLDVALELGPQRLHAHAREAELGVHVDHERLAVAVRQHALLEYPTKT